MLRNTTHHKRECHEQVAAALPSGPHNGSSPLAREVSAPAASLTRGITPQADSSGSTSASPSPVSAPVAHGRRKRRSPALREERPDCAVAQTTTRSDAPLRARSRSAGRHPAHCDASQATGEGEVSFSLREGHAAHPEDLASQGSESRRATTKSRARRRTAAFPPARAGVPPPADVIELVDAIFSQANPVDISVRLLNSGDNRISSKHLERLYEMRYGKPCAAPGADPDAPPIIEWNLPRPDRSGTT